jgi:hypothetical protein
VVDSTGVVSSCAPDLRAGTYAGPSASAPAASAVAADVVDITWNEQQCGPQSDSIRGGREGSDYRITVVLDRLGAGGVACVDSFRSRHVQLHAQPSVVSLLAAAPVSLAILAPSEDLTTRPTQIECSPGPGDAADASLAAHITLYDDTHRATACQEIAPNGADQLTATNPGGDTRVLEVNWNATPCESGPVVTIGALSKGFFVHGALPTAPCNVPAVAHTLRIELNADTPANDVVVQFDRDGPTTSGQPPVRVECTDAAGVSIVDVLGVVASCSRGAAPTSIEDGAEASNPSGDKN